MLIRQYGGRKPNTMLVMGSNEGNALNELKRLRGIKEKVGRMEKRV